MAILTVVLNETLMKIFMSLGHANTGTLTLSTYEKFLFNPEETKQHFAHQCDVIFL